MPTPRPMKLVMRLALCVSAGFMLLAPAASAAAAESGDTTVSFRNDVMAVLSRAGCNMGLCHGNLNGKGGLKLTLRGEAPEIDYITLTRDQFARRVNVLSPDQSLILKKAVAAMPHEGGKRFDIGSPEYRIIQQWIAAGARDDSQSVPHVVKLTVTPVEQVIVEPQREIAVKVLATFSDKSQRDVTHLTVLEPTDQLVDITPTGVIRAQQSGATTVIARYLHLQSPIRLAFVPDRRDFEWSRPRQNNQIDRKVFSRLKSLRINPSTVCSDSTFIRRVYLDLLGLLPPPDEARAFVADKSADKRERLVDRLLARPEFADFWALKWSDLLRNEEKLLDTKGVTAFHGWIRQSMAENKPLDVFARQLVSARGSTYENAPANYYRALREPTLRAEATAQLFLGVRLQCARCHNHPFDRWTMDDYYGFSAMFARVDYKIIENKKRDKSDKMMFIGEQIVETPKKGEITNARTGKPAVPTYLGAKLPTGVAADDDRLTLVADWIASADNKLFAQAMANRIWFHLMGRGIIEPIDDIRATNPPSNPQLQEVLTAELIRSGFDLRHMIRFITSSRVYQLAAEPNATNAGDTVNFSRAYVRRLTAEQMLDAMSVALAAPSRFDGYPEGARAAQVRGTTGINRIYRDIEPAAGDQFLKLFGKPPRLLNCECERSSDTALGQVFELTSGPAINDLLSRRDNRLGQLLAAKAEPAKMIDELYWAALSRAPSKVEAAAHVKYLAAAADKRAALEDIAWGLLNAKEFVLRH